MNHWWSYLFLEDSHFETILEFKDDQKNKIVKRHRQKENKQLLVKQVQGDRSTVFRRSVWFEQKFFVQDFSTFSRSVGT